MPRFARTACRSRWCGPDPETCGSGDATTGDTSCRHRIDRWVLDHQHRVTAGATPLRARLLLIAPVRPVRHAARAPRVVRRRRRRGCTRRRLVSGRPLGQPLAEATHVVDCSRGSRRVSLVYQSGQLVSCMSQPLPGDDQLKPMHSLGRNGQQAFLGQHCKRRDVPRVRRVARRVHAVPACQHQAGSLRYLSCFRHLLVVHATHVFPHSVHQKIFRRPRSASRCAIQLTAGRVLAGLPPCS